MRHFALSSFLLSYLRGAYSFDQTFGWNSNALVESRTLDEIHQAALAEGGTVTLWHGGGSPDQLDPMKEAFEKRFPGMTLNVTVKSSSYLGPELDRQLATENVQVDNIMLQTAQDYPRWKNDGVLLQYKPLDFDKVYNAFKDLNGAWVSSAVNGWSILYDKNKLGGVNPPETFLDFLKPEFKNKIVLTYPNEDDAILHTFDLIMEMHGLDFFNKLLEQNIRWVPGANIPPTLIAQPNNTFAVTFTTTIGLQSQGPFTVVYPSSGAPFTSWAQRSAILKDAPHPEGAKLLQNYAVSSEYQQVTGSWSVRKDDGAPAGYSRIFDTVNTDPIHFQQWMGDRQRVERLRFWFQDKLGYPKE
ncbi:unnamed protein product [Clonostachys rosea f. rosea IK726]|uniref:ABC-type Fe3+ transport system n=2 Tax=Bionectria ochroleuca TaxID=29856 RepID=A0A0B7K9H5_BIOOC|nr:unnamed protein product [Clonostachys rosea f. rosea IK726]